MKCLILCAGYATRLYPLTENFPKPLLEVGGKTILDWLIDDIETANAVEEYVVVSNHKYFNNFIEWAKDKPYKITVVDDGTSTNETRLGAVKDIQFAIDELQLDTDMLVIAGDNVLDFSLAKFINYAKDKQSSCIMRYYEAEVETLRECGVVEIDESDRIISMEEKPSEPKSNWCCPPFYYYTKNDSSKIKDCIESGFSTDAPGSFISWLCEVSPVYAMEMNGRRYDIGNLESYEQVKREYKGII